jgi:hypothetical protein
VLVSSRVGGQGWDTAPRVLLVQSMTTVTETPPTARGRPLAQILTVAWPNLTVSATDFVATRRAPPPGSPQTAAAPGHWASREASDRVPGSPCGSDGPGIATGYFTAMCA